VDPVALILAEPEVSAASLAKARGGKALQALASA